METPADWGSNFTKSLHQKAEEPTEAKNTELPPDFTVLVTGAGKGLGWHIATAFAEAGAANVIVASRTQADLDKLTVELMKINSNVNVLARTCDTMKEADVERLAGETKQKDFWDQVLTDDVGLCGGFLTWLTKERRDWLSGRYLSAT